MSAIISQRDVLPMHLGYALGSIIKKSDFLLPLKNKVRLNLEEELEKANIEKVKVTNSPSETETIKNEKQTNLNILNAKINKIKKDYNEVCSNISKLYESRNFFSTEEMLPIDPHYSKVKIVADRSFFSEKMSHLVFKKTDTTGTDLHKKIERFVSQLFSQDAPSSLLSSGMLGTVTNSIENMLETESQIYLVGSFITLPHVRVMDPIVLRRNATISNTLKEQAREYYVLAEAVLGAVFLGCGKYITGSGQGDKEGVEKPESLMSKVSMISYISQGAIPRPGKDAEDINMWNVYAQWKQVLLEDPLSGYPIGFKVRELQDVFSENKISVIRKGEADTGS
ncbi:MULTISPECIES: hypothetical protein [unclassified Neochlamydia]|uniref:hypothetical protein n=1 Tax=unclassified Neochlamydia TaxID=2643326 RepID=UPI001BC9DB69|nr:MULTISPECIES: hypothetical protein [unclassified Neochlamydia]MBS4166225.1 Uncharacterized protein [Neochlamydia sp. AcF65]MBS4170364.1 Uncharacterized protein [Neochlamydia sp. AcF95]